MYYRGFKYNLGEIINDKLILTQYYVKKEKQKKKFYKYKCIKCGFVGEKSEYDLSKGCPICNSNRYIHSNINSIKVTDPQVYELIIDDDACNYSRGSSHKVNWKCPNCGNINHTQIKHLTKDSLPCKYCSDGVSFPEKILNSVMVQISKTYENQKIFSWSQYKKYDVYDAGIFIEIHGQQHYLKSFETCGGRTLCEEQINDSVKMKLAKENDLNYIDYITIDARFSDFDFIKRNILKSNLSNYYDLSIIDWGSVKNNVGKSLTAEAGKLHNSGYDSMQISILLNVSRGTAIKYLHTATSLGICNYNPKELTSNKKRIICTNTGDVFKSATEASKWLGIKTPCGILRCCNGELKTSGTHPITGERLTWKLA